MLFHANMPESFWAEAMSMATQSVNYLLSKAIGRQIPWQLWHKRELLHRDLLALKPRMSR